MVAQRDAFEARRVGSLPFLKESRDSGIKSSELRMTEDGSVDVGRRYLQTAVAGATRRFEQERAHGRKHLPVTVERINVAVRDAAPQMSVDVLQVFRLGAIDVTREVEVEVILRVADLR